MEMYAVIMAGGFGTRFWPLSRQERPKQLLRLFSEKTLLEETVERLHPLFPPERILILANQEHVEEIRRLVPEVPPQQVIGEPVGRNTAPCIALAAFLLESRSPGSAFCVLPADHFIQDSRRFRCLLESALKTAESTSQLVTFGIIPNRPHTGYGYIRAGEIHATIDNLAVLKAEQFVEKPNRHTAEEYLAKGNYYWNSGMFAWKSSVILEEFELFQPAIVAPLREFFQGKQVCLESLESDDFAATFARLPSISIDYAIMEKSRRVVLLRADFGWDDVGSWESLDILPHNEAGNVVLGQENQLIDTRRCIVYGRETFVACLGVEDLIVVATGDAVLISRKDRTQEVKTIVERLRQAGRTELL